MQGFFLYHATGGGQEPDPAQDSLEIQSAVYTVSSDDGAYTFWFSPTAGLVSPDAMLLADDYIKIQTRTASGDIDLSDDGAELSYDGLAVNSSNYSSDFTSASASLSLRAENVVSMNVDVTSVSGRTIKTDFYGFCTKYDPDAASAAEEDGTICLDKAAFYYYFGETDGLREYYLLLTDAAYTGDTGGTMMLTEEGYILSVDLCAVQDAASKYVLPSGTYTEGSSSGNFFYTTSNTMVIYFDESLQQTQYQLAETVEVTVKDDVYTISALFLDSDLQVKRVSFTGELPEIYDTTLPTYTLPQIGKDVNVEGVSANAVYYGNMLEGGAGMMQINIMDQNFVDGNTGGLLAVLTVFNDLFDNSRDIRVMPGEYVYGTSFKWGTWLYGVELKYDSLVYPYGTYVALDDGSQYGQYAYAEAGTISITEVSEGYHVEFNLTTAAGNVLTGSFTGSIAASDQSDDDSDDDGTSTLVRDYELDLSAYKSVTVKKTDELWVLGLGRYENIAQYGCGMQTIDFGNFYGDDGDVLRLELLTETGREGELLEGSYEITQDRYPASFEPGVCVRGTIADYGTLLGSTFAHYYSRTGDSGRIYHYLDAHACLYSGTVTVEKSEDGNYTFTINAYDVREHNVTGTWTGPVSFSGASASAATAGTDARPSASMLAECLKNRPSYRLNND